MMFAIILQIFWVVFIFFQLKTVRDSKRRRRQQYEEMTQDLFSYVSNGKEYTYGEPFVPKLPVYCSDVDKKVWLSTEIVEVEQNIVFNDMFGSEFYKDALNTPIKRYFTSEFAMMAKLKDQNLEEYFKPGRF